MTLLRALWRRLRHQRDDAADATWPHVTFESVDAVQIWDGQTGETVYEWFDPEVWREDP